MSATIYDSLYSGARPRYSEQYRFDPEGDEISRRYFRNDTLESKIDFSYGVNGVQTVYTDLKSHVTRVDSTRRLPDGRYKTIMYSLAFFETPPVNITSFMNGGQEVILQHYQDTSIQEKPYISYHAYYSGDTLLRSTEESSAGKFDTRYYYSRSALPDTMVSFDGDSGKVVVGRRLLNFINDHGDAFRRVDIYGKDTAEIDSFQYQYDRFGNWTRLDFVQENLTRGVRTRQATVFTRAYVY